MVDDASVHFLWYSVVKTAVTCLHVKNRDTHSFRNKNAECGIGITQNQNTIRGFLQKHSFASRKNLPNLACDRLASYPEIVIGFSDLQLAKKNITKLRGKILPRMHKDVISDLIELFNDSGKSDDFWTSAKNCKYL